ncbi:flagellar hook protein, epsilonproteobacterial variant [Campylobacter sp. RM5004]|uniref:flagellar hook protein FlgE n=1 Tax=Campylobacter sp. RM5004 TaxID=1660078 RepID=UPI001EFAC5EE|nr:flagellar hook protein FlgE [Campylobacter sp. RM5004]ULO02477.1 flagellar hook protein, epsilonproteobacterial variant [Campylobacter sp. RM5004]
MMRSLWSGVSGLQAHQIAMDVEGNNIANVNTTGFKHSRANFSDLMNQTSKVATAPQGELGGKNPMQVGLGTQINSITKIFAQGSIQTTKKNTDLAIQGDGFFVVSPDGGKTYKYTRNGDFVRDAYGNFVDNNGYIAQGWLRDEVTGEVDTTSPIRNIVIKPGLTTPANPTTLVSLKANLNSGNSIGDKKTPIYQLDSNHEWTNINGDGIKVDAGVHKENDVSQNRFITTKDGQLRLNERGVDMGVLFNASGESLGLRKGQGIWVSYAEARTQQLTLGNAGVAGAPTIDNNGSFNTAATLNIEINGTQISASVANIGDMAAAINGVSGKTGVRADIVNGNRLVLINDNKQGTTAAMKNIILRAGNGGQPDNTGLLTTGNGYSDKGDGNNQSIKVITAYQYTYDPNPTNTTHALNANTARTFNTTEDLREAMQKDARLYVNYDGRQVTDANWLIPQNGQQGGTKNDGVEIIVDAKGQFVIKNPKGDAFNGDDGDQFDMTTEAINNRARLLYQAGNGNGMPQPPVQQWDQLTAAQQAAFIAANPNLTTPANTNTNEDDFNMFLSISNLTNPANNVNENDKFMKTMQGMQGALTSGDGIRQTQGLYMSAHSSSIDIFDSLGTKHSIKYDFTKIGYTDDGGTEWGIVIQVPEPCEINISGEGPKNVLTGTIRFNSDGSLQGFSPSSVSFTANNGSTPNQNIDFYFGNPNDFDGITSYDRESNTSGISQDGFSGGDLNGIRIDESGTIIGSFTNGRSFGLAQIAMATFTNNEGLEAEGGNVFTQTSNSGEPVIGAATTGGRGKIQASSLEMSNVDLSTSLTNLIVIQRGYQANSKTITTSDQMLNTLLQLKQ